MEAMHIGKVSNRLNQTGVILHGCFHCVERGLRVSNNRAFLPPGKRIGGIPTWRLSPDVLLNLFSERPMTARQAQPWTDRRSGIFPAPGWCFWMGTTPNGCRPLADCPRESRYPTWPPL